MKYKKAKLKPDEKACLQLRGLYEQYGYKKYKMGKFEEYSLYAENKDFLGSDKVITFKMCIRDSSGKGIKNGLEAALMKKIWFHLGWQMKMGI